MELCSGHYGGLYPKYHQKKKKKKKECEYVSLTKSKCKTFSLMKSVNLGSLLMWNFLTNPKVNLSKILTHPRWRVQCNKCNLSCLLQWLVCHLKGWTSKDISPPSYTRPLPTETNGRSTCKVTPTFSQL